MGATSTARASSDDLSKAVAFFGGAEMPARVWSRKYRLRDRVENFLEESPLQTFCRMADAVGAATDSSLRQNLIDRRIIPAGRMLFALGNPYFKACVKNCFVLLPKDDSLESISALRGEMARTYAMGGGVGIDLSRLRPFGSPVNNSAITSSGAASFADGFSHLTGEIGQNGRRGALMISISVDHPDVQRFIRSKNDFSHDLGEQLREKLPRKLFKQLVEEVVDPRRTCANANMSVRVTDRFMKAVKDGAAHVTRFVMDTGAIVEKVFDARELWGEIIGGAWAHGCPGVMFWDTAAREDNRNYLDERWHIVTTNPSLRAGTKVLTKSGVVPIETLDGQCFEVRNLKGEWAQAKCWLSGKNKPLWRVTLQNGVEYYATQEHKWPVQITGGGWTKVTTDALQPGNRLPFSGPRPLGIDGDSSLTKEDGFLAGYLYGDGWISERETSGDGWTYGIYFSEEKRPMADRLLTSLNAYQAHTQPTTRPINITKSDDGYSIQFSSSALHGFLVDRFGVGPKEDGLPSKLWRSNDDFIAGFIDGLVSTDGYVDAKRPRVVVTSSKQKMAQDLHDLFGFLGLKSVYSEAEVKHPNFPNGKSYERTYTRYDVTLNGEQAIRFAQMFTLSHTEKNARLQVIAKTHSKTKKPLDGVVAIRSVEKTDLCEDVWDISVDDETHCFTLSHCVTGNCGEMFLSDGGSCNLGAINLAKFTSNPYTDRAQFDWEGFKQAIRDGVDFLDEVNDIELREKRAPLKKQAEVTEGLRQIGLGVMGYGDLLLQHRIRYDSDESFVFTEKLFRCLRDTAYHQSIMRAKALGAFPAYSWEKIRRSPFIQRLPAELQRLMEKHGLRNSNILSIAPTGSIAMMGETTGSIEPEFAFQLTRSCNLGDGRRTKFTFLTPTAQRIAHALGKSVPRGEIEGAVDMSWLPDWAVAAHQIDPCRRAKLQGLIQQFVDVSISSTVNLPENATVEDVATVYKTAYESGCKGITIYREGSRGGVLETLQEETRLEFPIEPPLQINSHRISFKGENGLQRILINLGDYQPGVPCEVSVIHGKSGTEVASYASALGIIISIALQNGVHPTKLAKALEGINAGWTARLALDGKGNKPTTIHSVPDAIAAALQKFYGNGIYEKGVLGQSINGASNKVGWELTAEERQTARTCPKCQKQTYVPDSGCWKCINPACDAGSTCG